MTSVADLPIEQILAYLAHMELTGSPIGEDMLLPLFSELSVTELEELLEESGGEGNLVALIM